MNNHRQSRISRTFHEIMRIVTLAILALALVLFATVYVNRLIDRYDSYIRPHMPDEIITSGDYYNVEGNAQRLYQPKEGQITYCAVDIHSRPTCVYGLLTPQVRAKAQARGRQDITINPTGWPTHNTKAQIGSYHGWFWNRSHLLADSLGGDPIKENLVTGTRTQNIGNSKARTGGMTYTETLARNWLDNPSHAQCPLYYAVTPVYANNTELIPRTVVVDIESCDQSLSQHVIVPNIAEGWEIDYTTAQVTKTD